MDAIRYLDRTGCQWDAVSADFSHPKLVYHWERAKLLLGFSNHAGVK